MDFTVKKAVLSDALSLACGIVPERSARLILQNLMLSVTESHELVVSATDLEIGVKMTLPAEDLRDPGSVLLPASRLNSLVKGSQTEKLRFEVLNHRAEISTDRGKFVIPGQDVVDYPVIPPFKDEGAFFIHGDDFRDAVQKTVFATAKGDTRYALNGIFIKVLEDEAEFVASDTHRLSYVKKGVRNPNKTVAEGIMIIKGMSSVAKLAAETDLLQIRISDNEMTAKTESAVVVIRRVEGVFPRYHDVIPPKMESVAVLRREEFMDSLLSVGTMTPEETRSVTVSLETEEAVLSGNSDFGEGRVRLDAEVRGPKLEIKFNYLFLIDALKNMASEKVEIQYKDASSPARIDDGDFMYVLMPVNR